MELTKNMRHVQSLKPLKHIRSIKAHKKQGHNFLHIGLVQVGVKTLIRKGLNSSILMALRDTRYIRFNDSLLGTI